jgi:hypothetical protein
VKELVRAIRSKGSQRLPVHRGKPLFISAVVSLLVLCLVLIFFLLRESPSESPEANGLPTIIQREGPLGGGDKVTTEQARTRVSYALPIPPTDESTGERWGVWIAGGQVAFTWDSGLRFYVQPSNLLEEKMTDTWEQKAKQEPQLWELLQVRGHSAIGLSSETSSLTWLEDGLSLQLVSPSHSLDELTGIAGQIEK